jgi:hypothetical protein
MVEKAAMTVDARETPRWDEAAGLADRRRTIRPL